MRLIHISLLLLICLSALAQGTRVTISGILKDKKSTEALPFVNLVLKSEQDSAFIAGTVSGEDGRFTLTNVAPGNYVLEISYVGYSTSRQRLLVGKLSQFLDLGVIELTESTTSLSEVVVVGKQDAVAETLDKKTFNVADNINQSGGSLLQVMQNLPGITLSGEGTVKLRGNDKVIVLIDGKQTALTGFGNQRVLHNIPA